MRELTLKDAMNVNGGSNRFINWTPEDAIAWGSAVAGTYLGWIAGGKVAAAALGVTGGWKAALAADTTFGAAAGLGFGVAGAVAGFAAGMLAGKFANEHVVAHVA